MTALLALDGEFSEGIALFDVKHTAVDGEGVIGNIGGDGGACGGIGVFAQ